MKKQAKENKKEAFERFELAAQNFEEIKAYKNSAQCYYTCKQYEKAAELFELNNQPLQCAECLKIIGQFEKAAQIYEENEIYLRAFECYEAQKDWESLILSLSRNKDKFSQAERDNLMNRYLPMALSGVYQQLNENGQDEEYKEQNIKKKYQDTNVIDEESDFSDDEYDQDNSQEDKLEETNSSQNNISKELEEEIIDTSTKKQEDEQENRNEESKNDTSVISDFTLLSKAELSQDFDHLSNFDPEDDFLKSENSYSIIGSVLCRDEDTLSEYSDVSIISGSRVSQIRGGNVIDSSIDYFAQDRVIKKIIFYLSLFSEDMKENLKQHRSKTEMANIDQNKDELDFIELELDNLDEELVSIILNMLEHFDLFRLCFMLCNKYNLKTHISRYFTSTCYKYSNLKLLEMGKITTINSDRFRTSQRKVSVLANEAIHNILKLVDPTTIRQQCTEDLTKESTLLSGQSWRYIYYLGFWKKLIYLMDTHNALKLGYSMKAFEDFKTVYLINYCSELTDQEILSKVSNSAEPWVKDNNSAIVEYLCRKIALEESVETLDNCNLHPDTNCNRNLNLSLKSLNDGDKSKATLHIIEAVKATDSFSQLLSNPDRIGHCLSDIDRYSPEYYDNKQLFIGRLLPLFDIFLFYGRIFTNQQIKNLLREVFTDRVDVFFKCIKVVKFCVNLVDNPTSVFTSFTPVEVSAILQGLFTPMNVRIPEMSDLMLNSNLVGHIHRESEMYKEVPKYISMLREDKYNKEYYSKTEEIITSSTSLDLFRTSVVEVMKKVKENFVSNNHNYSRIYIADIDAEYISCPISILLFWYKKHFMSFITKIVIKEDLREYSEYTDESINSNENSNEVILPQTVQKEYLLGVKNISAYVKK